MNTTREIDIYVWTLYDTSLEKYAYFYPECWSSEELRDKLTRRDMPISWDLLWVMEKSYNKGTGDWKPLMYFRYEQFAEEVVESFRPDPAVWLRFELHEFRLTKSEDRYRVTDHFTPGPPLQKVPVVNEFEFLFVAALEGSDGGQECLGDVGLRNDDDRSGQSDESQD
jgi:hypothetical protein